ncbi:hypothetical protein LHT40_003055 [Escherichia coli]|uniref:hypothetical protein n=1 Tax=Escherichia coli TaxID=562 RepID=UPI0003901F0F|nr:hypothetical protein [Escherichia coli]EFE5709084.1 hypothetical protein [Escherichia coli]EHO7895681.1 hypothetical protein [Escherichia coli]EII6559952.1 hypothetical protein [Escherichia coli]EJR2154966.1 hypothetical protein [Escherichia coli]EKL2827071.1 hypothetical protein [Escherichia coli]
MKKETVKCPFCFKESEFRVRICTGCHSSITYGEVSGLSALLIGFILLVITYIILYITQNLLVGIITFFALVILMKLYIRKKFAHRAVFIHKS